VFVSTHRRLDTLVRRASTGGLAAALLLALPAAAQAPQLLVHDAQVGITHAAPSEHSLKVGHTLDFEILAAPGRVGVLAFGAPHSGAPILIGGAPLQLAPASILVALSGQLVPASGSLGLSAVVPALPEGTSIWTQAATIDVATLDIELSSPLRGKATLKPFVHVAAGSKTTHPQGQTIPQQLLIQSDPAWQAFWAQHSPLPAPTIDFNAWGALVAFRGLTPSTVYGIRVDQTTSAGALLDVAALHLDPIGGCATQPTQQQPFHIVAVPLGLIAPLGAYTAQVVDNCP